MISRYSDNRIDWEETLDNCVRVCICIAILALSLSFSYRVAIGV